MTIAVAFLAVVAVGVILAMIGLAWSAVREDSALRKADPELYELSEAINDSLVECRRVGCGHAAAWHEHYTSSTHCAAIDCSCGSFSR